LKQLVASHGEDVAALMLSAQLHAQRGQFDEALADCDRAIEQAPRRASLYATKAGLIAGDQQRYGEALSIVDRAIELDPLLVSARHLRSRIHRSLGDMDAAIWEYEQLLDKSPHHAGARVELSELYDAANRLRQLETLLAESAKLYRSDPIWPQRQAAVALRTNDTKTALEKLELAFELDPKPSALFALASVHITAGNPADALRVLDANETLLESEPGLQAQRGRALWMLGQKNDATAVFGQALRQAYGVDQLLSARNQIVAVHGLAGTGEVMLTAFGTSPPFIVQVAVAELLVKEERFGSAVLHLKGLNPQVRSASTELQRYFHHTYATALHHAGHAEQAEAAYRRLLELRPNNPVMLNNLAFLLVDQLDRPSEAAVAAERALRLRPNDPLIMDTLGWSLFKTGDVDRARRLLEASYRLRPLAVVSLHLAEVLEHLGLAPSAVEVLHSGKTLAERFDDQATLKLINERLERLGR
jgi:tetratricopeptide (TPR) repeat protein